MPINKWDIGECCCCPCEPCPLPKKDLNFTATGTLVYGTTQSGEMGYSYYDNTSGHLCTWETCIAANFTNSIDFSITCASDGTTTFKAVYETDEVCNGDEIATYDLAVCSYTCDPLSITLKINCTGANALTITITE